MVCFDSALNPTTYERADARIRYQSVGRIEEYIHTDTRTTQTGPPPVFMGPQDCPLKMACLILPLPKQFGCIQPCTNHIRCAQRTDQVLAYIRHEDRHKCRASHVANLGVDRYLGIRRTSHSSFEMFWDITWHSRRIRSSCWQGRK